MSLVVGVLEENNQTNDDNDNAEPPKAFAQRPNTIAEGHLDDKRDKCIHCRDVNWRKPRLLESFEVSKSNDKPVIDIGTSQSRLNSFQKKDEINCF